MQIKLKDGRELDADIYGNYRIVDEIEKLPDGCYETEKGHQIEITDGRIINILDFISTLGRLLLRLFRII